MCPLFFVRDERIRKLERPEIKDEDHRAIYVGDELVCMECMTDEDWGKVWFGCVVSSDYLSGMDDAYCDRCGKNLGDVNVEKRN